MSPDIVRTPCCMTLPRDYVYFIKLQQKQSDFFLLLILVPVSRIQMSQPFFSKILEVIYSWLKGKENGTSKFYCSVASVSCLLFQTFFLPFLDTPLLVPAILQSQLSSKHGISSEGRAFLVEGMCMQALCSTCDPSWASASTLCSHEEMSAKMLTSL